MSEFKTTKDYSLVSIILPKLTGEPVVESLSSHGARHILQSTSRGSMLNEGGGFFSKMFPPPAPEQELFQLLVPSAKLGGLMTSAVKAGYLDRAGGCAIFAMPCDGEVQLTSNFPLLTDNGDVGAGAIGDPYMADLVAIIGIVEIGVGDSMAEAALKAGSSGPTITFGEGGGVRDKIRLLRLTKGPEKEIVIAAVEKGEADNVFAEMARSGKITEPGRGFMYTTPINRGLINISTTFSSGAGASLDQIIGAIDEIKGGKDWRSTAPEDSSGKSTGGKPKLLTDLTELVGLYCLVHRDNYPAIYDAILNAGAGGVSVVFGTLRDPSASADQANEEWASVQTSIAPAVLEKVRDAIKDTVKTEGIDSACLFTHKIEKAATYLP